MPDLSRVRFVLAAAAAALLSACSGSDASVGGTPGTTSDGGDATDSGTLTDAPSGSDAAPPVDANAGDAPVGTADAGPVTACPTTGKGAITAPDTTCLLVTPAQAGANAAGENATVPSYALAPNTGRKGKLVVFFNASESHPGNEIADPTQSFYTAATSLGYSVVALSYASAQVLGLICSTDACYGPTRETILRGVPVTGASPKVQNIQPDEGAIARLVMLLRWLDANDASHGWSEFLVPASAGKPPAQQVAWDKVTTAGHSQGGGHAAMVGKLLPVSRVLQLSSTCDQVGGTPASWTNAAAGTWQTASTAFWGLAAPTTFTAGKPSAGDTICGYHTAVWQSLGMTPAHSDDAAATCGNTGQTHGVSIGCKDNYPAWQAMLQ